MNEDKIPQVIGAMLQNHKRIKNVQKAQGIEEEEYYFTYPDEKFLWSIAESIEGKLFLFYYPSKEDKLNFLKFDADKIEPFGAQSFKELLSVIRGKMFGFDAVLEEILK